MEPKGQPGATVICVAGCIIQVPTLEGGDRLVIEEPAQYMPLVLPITYLIEGTDTAVVTARYINIDELPNDLKKACEDYIKRRSD